MCMNINRQFGRLLQGFDKVIRFIRRQKTGHILDANRICPHFLDALCQPHPVFERVGISEGIRQRNLCFRSLFLAGIDSCLQIAEIIQAVKNAKNINTVCDGFLYEVLDHIIRIMIIAQDILTAEQHLQLSVLEALL